MSAIRPERLTAEIEGDFVVFLIGMRINAIWKPHKWLPVARAMGQMIRELEAAGPEVGFLGHNGLAMSVSVMYWRSLAHLDAYANSANHAHRPAWAAFNRRMAASRGDVGIWHETYLVQAGRYEALYSGMPPYGLGRVGRLTAALGAREAARGRLSQDA